MKMGGTNKENIGSGVEVTAAGVDVKQLFFPVNHGNPKLPATNLTICGNHKLFQDGAIKTNNTRLW